MGDLTCSFFPICPYKENQRSLSTLIKLKVILDALTTTPQLRPEHSQPIMIFMDLMEAVGGHRIVLHQIYVISQAIHANAGRFSFRVEIIWSPRWSTPGRQHSDVFIALISTVFRFQFGHSQERRYVNCNSAKDGSHKEEKHRKNARL